MSTANEISQNTVVVGDGVVTVIPYQFEYFNDENIDVLVTKFDTATEVVTELVVNVDYLKFVDRIQLGVPLAVGERLLVERVITDVQPLEYDSLRPFPDTVHEKQEDRTFMSLSGLKNMLKRVATLGKFVPQSVRVELPEPEAGKYLVWDGTSGKLANIDGTADLLTQTAAEVVYDNTGSTLTSGFVEGAIDELDVKVEALDATVSGLTPGEVNTASNVGVTANLNDAGLYKEKVLEDLRFKALKIVTDTVSNVGFLTENTNDITVNMPHVSVSVNADDYDAAIFAASSALIPGGSAYGTVSFDATSSGRIKFYWVDRNIWFTWDGIRWVPDDLSQLFPRVRAIYGMDNAASFGDLLGLASGSTTFTGTLSAQPIDVLSGFLAQSVQRTALTATSSSSAIVGISQNANTGSLYRSTTRSGSGFTFECTFGHQAGSGANATRRIFAGITSSIATITDANPSALTNFIGVGTDSGDANFQIMHNAASTTTKTDLGSDFAKAVNNNEKIYRLKLTNYPLESDVYWEFSDLSFSALSPLTVTGIIGSNLPPENLGLKLRLTSSVGGTSSPIGLNVYEIKLATQY